MPDFDLRPAAQRMSRLLEGVSDDALSAATPCADLPLSGLISHVGMFSQAFAIKPQKDRVLSSSPAPPPEPGPLEPGWRAQIAGDLAALGDAWLDPGAWEGDFQAGGVEDARGVRRPSWRSTS